MNKQERERHQEITHEMANLVYLIHTQWWRVRKNRERRQRVKDLFDEGTKLIIKS